MSTFTSQPQDRQRRRPGLFAASALSAAVAAMTLAACGPRDGTAITGGAPTVATATSTTPTNVPATTMLVPAPAPPAVSTADPAAMAAVPVQGRPVPNAPLVAAAPTTSPIYPADSPPMQSASMGVQPAPAVTRHAAQVAQAVPSGRVGSIEGIEPIRNRPQGSGAGAVIGGVLGAVVGNQFGHGLGRAAMTGVGVAGGAVAGNNLERNYKEGVVGYRVSVRLDNGASRTFERTSVGGLHVGDRVRVESSGSFHRV